MAYNRTIWEDGQTYGADAFNNIEEGILELEASLESMGGSGSQFVKSQTQNLSKAMSKLRQNQAVDIAFMGDSVFYAWNQTDHGEDKICTDDYGNHLNGFKATSVTIPDTFLEYMNVVYEGDITKTEKIWSGDTVATAFYRWKPTNSDIAIINYGINDAIGGHISDKYHPQIPQNYKGDVNLFIEAYRKVIEREIENGTAVVLLTPTKITMKGTSDVDDRIIVDIYEQAVINLGNEYSCPVINGNELVKNFGNEQSIDFCHYTDEGFRAIGYRLAAAFIGQSPLAPMSVTDGTYLGVNPQMHNVNIVAPTRFDSDKKSPNPPEMLESGDLATNVERVEKGLTAKIQGTGKVVWSFYCEHDGMVVVPSLLTPALGTTIHMKLDNGAVQGKWNNYWNVAGDVDANTSYTEPSTVNITNADLIGHSNKSYGLHVLKNTTQPVLKITTAGWHTLEISATFPGTARDVDGRSHIPEDVGNGSVFVYGINFLSLDSYNSRVFNKVPLELTSNVTATSSAATPYLMMKNGKASLIGSVQGLTVSDSNPIASFDAKFAPKQDTAILCSAGAATSGNIATILVTTAGKVMFAHTTGGATQCSLNGVTWHIGE